MPMFTDSHLKIATAQVIGVWMKWMLQCQIKQLSSVIQRWEHL